MDKIKIIGGNQLNGKIYISGAKNAALPLICSSLLTEDKVILKNVPQLSDITFLNSLLENLGLKVIEEDTLLESHTTKKYTYQADDIKELVAPYDFVRKMRASYYVLGPFQTRGAFLAGRMCNRCTPDRHPSLIFGTDGSGNRN